MLRPSAQHDAVEPHSSFPPGELPMSKAGSCRDQWVLQDMSWLYFQLFRHETMEPQGPLAEQLSHLTTPPTVELALQQLLFSPSLLTALPPVPGISWVKQVSLHSVPP